MMGAALADCNGDAVEPAVKESLAAWERVDLDGFDRAMDLLHNELPCVGDRLTPRLAASIHRVEALAAFGRDDTLSAKSAFGAMRRIDPSAGLSRELAPDGHPLRAALEASDSSTRFEDLPLIEGMRITVDGGRARQRPIDLPAVVQFVPNEGPSNTHYLWPSDALPIPKLPTPTEPTRERKGVPILGIAAAALATGAAGTFVGARTTRARYDDPGTPDADLDGLRKTTNTLVLTAAGLGGAAVVTGGIQIGVRLGGPR